MQAGLALAFKLLRAAEQGWRSVNGPHLGALVRAGAVVRKRMLIARQTTTLDDSSQPALISQKE